MAEIFAHDPTSGFGAQKRHERGRDTPPPAAFTPNTCRRVATFGVREVCETSMRT
jgi:hypothetical protein